MFSDYTDFQSHTRDIYSRLPSQVDDGFDCGGTSVNKKHTFPGESSRQIRKGISNVHHHTKSFPGSSSDVQLEALTSEMSMLMDNNSPPNAKISPELKSNISDEDVYPPLDKTLPYSHQDPYVAEDVMADDTTGERRRSHEFLHRSHTSGSFDLRSDPSPLSTYSTDYSTTSGYPPYREFRSHSYSSDSNSSLNGLSDSRERSLGPSSIRNPTDPDNHIFLGRSTHHDPEAPVRDYPSHGEHRMPRTYSDSTGHPGQYRPTRGSSWDSVYGNSTYPDTRTYEPPVPSHGPPPGLSDDKPGNPGVSTAPATTNPTKMGTSPPYPSYQAHASYPPLRTRPHPHHHPHPHSHPRPHAYPHPHPYPPHGHPPPHTHGYPPSSLPAPYYDGEYYAPPLHASYQHPVTSDVYYPSTHPHPHVTHHAHGPAHSHIHPHIHPHAHPHTHYAKPYPSIPPTCVCTSAHPGKCRYCTYSYPAAHEHPHIPLYAPHAAHPAPGRPTSMAYYDYGLDEDAKQPPLLPTPSVDAGPAVPGANPYVPTQGRLAMDAMSAPATTGTVAAVSGQTTASTSKKNRKSSGKDNSGKKKELYLEIIQEIEANDNDITTISSDKLVTLMRCHSGCKFLQTLLDTEVTPGGPLNSHLFSVILPLATGLSINPYGNYIFQKMIPRLLPEQRLLLTRCLLGQTSLNDVLETVPGAQVPDPVVRTELLRPLYDGFKEADAATQSLPPFLRSALDVHGTRSIQKLINVVWSDAQCMDLIMQEFRQNNKSIVKLAQHPNGCHVLFVLLNMGFVNTQIIEDEDDDETKRDNKKEKDSTASLNNMESSKHVMTRTEFQRIEEFRQWVVSIIADHLIELACHKNGSGIVIRAVEVASKELRKDMMDRFVQSAIHISADPFGNFVASYILDSGSPEEVEVFFNALKGHLLDLSLKKFGSNVIERCLGVLKGRIGSGTSPYRKSRVTAIPRVYPEINSAENTGVHKDEHASDADTVTLHMDRDVIRHTVEELLGMHPISPYVFDIPGEQYVPSPTGNVRCLETLLASGYGNYVLQSVLPAAKVGGTQLINILYNLVNPLLPTLTRTQIHTMFISALLEQYPNRKWDTPSWWVPPTVSASATKQDE